MFKEVQKSLVDYGKILKKAWHSTWHHKSLWLFAVLAGGINSGVIFNDLVRSTWRLDSTDAWSSTIILQSVQGLDWLMRYVQELLAQGTIRIIGSFTLLVIAVGLFLFLAVVGQQLLVTGISHHTRRKRILAFSQIVKELRHMHFWQLLSINLLMHLVLAILILALAFPLTALLGAAPDLEGLIYFAFYVVLVPLVFMIHALGLFSIIYAIRHNASFHEIITRSWKMLSNHWLAAIELAVIIFFLNVIVAAVGFALSLLTTVPLGIIAFASTAGGSTYYALGIALLGLLALFIFTLIISGAMITFNYSAWVHLLERSERSAIMPALEHGFTRVRNFFVN